jgi:hypothetical protein
MRAAQAMVVPIQSSCTRFANKSIPTHKTTYLWPGGKSQSLGDGVYGRSERHDRQFFLTSLKFGRESYVGEYVYKYCTSTGCQNGATIESGIGLYERKTI